MTQDPAYASPSGVPDAWVTVRNFVAGVDRAFYDQSYAGQDAYAYNPTGQFAVVGPYSVSPEGQPVAITRSGGVVISPAVVLIGLGVAAALLLKG